MGLLVLLALGCAREPVRSGPPSDAGHVLVSGSGAGNRYLAYYSEKETLYAGRKADCLNIIDTGMLPRNLVEEVHRWLLQSLHAGRVLFDETEAAACLAALRAADCSTIAAVVTATGDLVGVWPPGFEACGRELAGRVPKDGACLVPADCQDRVETACTSVAGQHTCPAYCRAHRNWWPPPRGTDGATCSGVDPCAFGFFCQRGTRMEAETFGSGRCRPLDAACSGTWACPPAFACVGAGPGGPGRCQVGKPLGAPCTPQGTQPDGVPISDCAPSLGMACADVDGRGPRCWAGAPLGQPCGPPLGEFVRRCSGGECRGPQGSEVCSPFRALNETCANDMAFCAPPGKCTYAGGSSICLEPPEEKPLGDACRGDDERECPVNAHCRKDPVGRTCTLFRKPGETCQGNWNLCNDPDGCPDRCEPLTNCVGGVCVKC